MSQEIHRAHLLNDAGRAKDAENLARSALAKDPTNYDAARELARSLSGQDRHAELLAVADAMVRTDPSAAFGHIYTSVALLSLKRPQEALTAALQVVRLLPNESIGHELVAWAALELPARQWPAGVSPIVAARNVLALAPDEADSHHLMGTVLMDQGVREGAQEAFHRALEIEPGHSRALNNLGMLHQSRWRFARSAALYAQSAAADLDADHARENLRRLLFTLVGFTAWVSGALWSVARHDAHSTSARVITGLILVAALMVGAIFVRRLQPHSRRVLAGLLRATRWNQVNLALATVMGVAVVGRLVIPTWHPPAVLDLLSLWLRLFWLIQWLVWKVDRRRRS